MRLIITSEDAAVLDASAHDLADDLRSAGLTQDVSAELVERPSAEPADAIAKGDPVTIAAIVLTLVGTGGALTAAVSSGGVLSRLVDVLEAYVKRELVIDLELPDGRRAKLSGPANTMRETVARLLRDSR